MIKRPPEKDKGAGKNPWKIAYLPILAFSILFLNGCGMWQLKGDLARLEQHQVVSGTITCDTPVEAPVVVVLWARDKSDTSGYWVTRCGMEFSFRRDSGSYYLAAFSDANEDGLYQASEYAGIYSQALDMGQGQIFQDLKIRLLPPGKAKVPDDIKLASMEEKAKKFLLRESQLGELTTMDNQIFSDTNGDMGLWTPLTFIEKIGIKIYFLEEYDPGKIPILFVHGSSGHPGLWKALINNIDRKKYQPWMAFYPSGMRLDDLGQIYSNFLDELRLKFGYGKIHVVAHSMGGLVGRSMLQHYSRLQNRARVPLFISLASPWAGHMAAGKGVQYAPSVVPAWFDMVPESQFLRDLRTQSLPVELKHYLIFAYQGAGRLFPAQENSDGTITLKSQLDMEIQNQAERIIGIDSNHVGILSDPATMEALNRILSRQEID